MLDERLESEIVGIHNNIRRTRIAILVGVYEQMIKASTWI